MTQLHELTALELAAAYRRGETDPVEAVDHFLDRIDRHADTVGAFVAVTPEAARAAAERARATLSSRDEAAGRDEVPALYGIPTAIKDLASTAGVPTAYGSAVFKGYVPEVSDEVVLRIERAGMISLGKTNTPEFGCPCYTEPDPSIAPPARSPYDLTRSAGGSSGGSAAAVSAGLLPIAHASDGGGSIRIPASVTGLVGFKPSRGRISKAPVYGDITGLSTSGPMARTVRDSAAMLDVMAGPALGDPSWAAPLPAGETYLGWCDREPRRLRIARWSDPVVSDQPVDPQVLAAYEHASEVLEGLGHEVVDVPPPVPANLISTFEVVWAGLATSTPLPPGASESQLRPLTRWLRGRGTAISLPEFAGAIAALQRVAARVIAATAEYDAVLTPTLAQLPAAVGQLRNDDDPVADFAAQVRYTPFCALWNVTGMPAVSLPMGWSTEGWPIGAMLAGRPAADHALYALAAQVEAACSDPGHPWRRPELGTFA